MTFRQRPAPGPRGTRIAGQCAFLRSTLSPDIQGDLLNLCMHITREGRECVGPFLDDAPTACGLWEPKHAGSPLPPLPPELRG